MKKKFTTRDAKALLDLTNRKAGMVSVNLYHGIQTFKKRISEEELERAWESGDWSRVMKVIPFDDLPSDLMPALNAVGISTFNAGKISIEALPANVNSRLRWDAANPVLRKYITDRTVKLVVGINRETQQVIQNAVVRSFNHAMTPRQMAKSIKSSIGLFPNQVVALQNYQMKLSLNNIGGKRLDNMVAQYENKLLNYRATMIARTEIRGATNMGQLSVWREASNQDLINGDTAKRVWESEGPDPCPICDPMDGVETGLDEPWVLEDGTQVDCPPWDVHPNCYCSASLVI